MDSVKLRKYLNPGVGMLIFGIALGVVTALAAILLKNARKTVIPPWLVIAVGAFFSISFIAVWFSMRKDYRKLFGTISKTDLDDLCEEFEASEVWFNDKFRVGKKHIFVQGDAELEEIREIKSVYEKASFKEGNESCRWLHIERENGTNRHLCILNPSGQDTLKVMQFANALAEIKPDAKYTGVVRG